MSGNKKLFLSAVSSEFEPHRNLLAGDLKRPDLDVAVQQDFIVTGGKTLEKLDTYIRHCDAVIHLIGKATGGVPEEPAVAALVATYPDLGTRLPPLAEDLRRPQPGFSYTQWEAYLAIYHQRPLYVYRPHDFELDSLHVPRADRFVFSPDEAQSQKMHYQRISALGHDRGQFTNEERLSSAVLRDLVEILPRLESTTDVRATRLRHTAERLIGRDEDLSRLDAAWNDPHKNVVIVRAWGGVGKTSLVATWMAELALKNWRGAERVFDWSFYSQGTRDQTSASADSFIAEALHAFGDPEPTLGSPWDRGARLARLVGGARALLVLDGLEPLQHPPGPMQGQLKDSGLSALLKGLAARNPGLCIVTTREKVDDIKQHYGRTADDVELTYLTPLAGAALLHYAGATRAGAKTILPNDRELQTASREVRGHGLTLQLLGQYLRLVEDGDILKRDTVRLADADQEYQNDVTRPYGHAFKAIEAYENWFAREGERGQGQLAILRVLGLFDRPASKTCLDALRAQPAIAGLTDALAGLSQREWKLTLSRLEDINLLVAQEDGSVDAHPLLREYFARRVREQQPEAWRAAHRRLYEHLCATTKEGDQPTLEGLQPLYQAVAHGCQAGMLQETCDKVYLARIARGREAYAMRKLGAFGSDLGAVACFFETPWSHVSPALTEAFQAWLLNEAAFRLRALGRLTEALEPMRAGLEMRIKQDNWKQAAVSGSNLSELELTLGEVAGAVRDAEHAVTYADRSGDAFQRESRRTTLADAFHQAGRRSDAATCFREAEDIHAKAQLSYPLLYGLSGFEYCDLLLTEAERGAWHQMLKSEVRSEKSEVENACRAVSERAAQTLKWLEAVRLDILSIALDHLTLGRAALYRAQIGGAGAPSALKSRQRDEGGDAHVDGDAPVDLEAVALARRELDAAVDGLRRAGTQDHLPRGLLTRAWCSAFAKATADKSFVAKATADKSFVAKATAVKSFVAEATADEPPNKLLNQKQAEDYEMSARRDLDEAWEIAERGPMPLFLADIHLYRARLFHAVTPYPWAMDPDEHARGPHSDLAEARRLIEKHGYWRRKEELEDAEAALENWPQA